MTPWDRYWFGGEEPPTRTAAFRVAFFAVVAIDAVTAVPHAAAYGAGGFNVSHVAWLDPWLPAPTREVVVASLLVQAWLAARLATGVVSTRAGGRADGALLAALFTGTLGWSQLDSYQHHWLVALVLAILAGVRWADGGPGWCLQLVRAQIALVYLWAVVPKLDGAWLDGSLPRRWLGPSVPWDDALLTRLGVAPSTVWSAVGAGTVAVEVALALALLVPRWRGWAIVPGVLFHLSIEASGLEIGWFSAYMVAAYLLIVPPAVWPRAAHGPGPAPTPPWLRAAVAVCAAAVIAGLPVDGAGWAAIAVLGLSLALDSDVVAEARPHPRVVGLWLSAALLGTPSHLWRDHHRYLGGDARRRGDPALAHHAYLRAARIDPSDVDAWAKAGDAALRASAPEAATEAWSEGVTHAADDPTALWAFAVRFDHVGEEARATALAERVLAVAPDHAEARARLGR